MKGFIKPGVLAFWPAFFSLAVISYFSIVEIYPAVNSIGELNLQSIFPPSFLSPGTNKLQGVFISCQNPGGQIAAQIGNVVSAIQGGSGGSGPIGIETACPAGGASAIKNAEDLECKNVRGEGGIFSDAKVEEIKNKNKEAEAALSCKKAKGEALKGEMQCLAQSGNGLSQQVASLQQAYLNNLQRFQEAVGKLKGILDDRKKQGSEVEERLIGNAKIQAPGLIGVKKAIENTFAGIPTEIAGFANQILDFKRQQKALAEEIVSHRISLTAKCFRETPDPGLKCDPTGKSVSPYEHAKCRLRQIKSSNRNHVREENPDQSRLAVAQSSTGSFTDLLDEILSQIPQNAKFTTDPKEVADRPTGISTIDDIKNQYLERMKALFKDDPVQGEIMSLFVFGRLGICRDRAKIRVHKIANTANGLFGAAQNSVKVLLNQMKSFAKTKIDFYSQNYTDAMRALTGQHVPLNVAKCSGADPDAQLSCMKEYEVNMRGLIQGTTPESAMNISVVGTSVPTIPVQCFGLSGCVTTMQNLSRALGTEIGRVDGFRKNYIQRANSSIDRFTAQAASMMSGPSQFLTDRIKQLNGALSTLGVKSGIKIKAVPTVKLEQIEEISFVPDGKEIKEKGLYDLNGVNVLNLIGSQTKPPMVDVSSDQFGNIEGLGEVFAKIDEEMSKIGDVNSKLEALRNECSAEDLEKVKGNLEDRIRELEEACGELDGYCDKYAASSLSEIIKAIKALNTAGSGSLDVSIPNHLGGISLECPDDDPSTGEFSNSSEEDERFEPSDLEELGTLQRELRAKEAAIETAREGKEKIDTGKKENAAELAKLIEIRAEIDNIKEKLESAQSSSAPQNKEKLDSASREFMKIKYKQISLTIDEVVKKKAVSEWFQIPVSIAELTQVGIDNFYKNYVPLENRINVLEAAIAADTSTSTSSLSQLEKDKAELKKKIDELESKQKKGKSWRRRGKTRLAKCKAIMSEVPGEIKRTKQKIKRMSHTSGKAEGKGDL